MHAVKRPYVGIVRHLVRLTAYVPSAEGRVPGPCLKVAFCDFYQYHVPFHDRDIGEMLCAREYSSPRDTFCDQYEAVLLDKIDRKLVCAAPDRSKQLTTDSMYRRLFFLKYNFSSNML